jgi:hypothetical protein
MTGWAGREDKSSSSLPVGHTIPCGKENEMSRKSNVLTLTVQAWPKLTEGKCYRGRVKAVRVDRTHASPRLHVVIENLDPDDQHGRVHELALRIPIHPGSRTALFLLACGMDASIAGTSIRIDQTVGAVLGMRFHGFDADGTENFGFERIEPQPAAGETDPSTSKSVGEDTGERA